MTRPSGYLASPRAWISGRPSTAPDPLFDPSVANPARVYGYWLGGKDHYQADRDPPDAGAELLAFRVRLLDRRGQPGPIGREPQAGHPRKRNKCVEIAE